MDKEAKKKGPSKEIFYEYDTAISFPSTLTAEKENEHSLHQLEMIFYAELPVKKNPGVTGITQLDRLLAERYAMVEQRELAIMRLDEIEQEINDYLSDLRDKVGV